VGLATGRCSWSNWLRPVGTPDPGRNRLAQAQAWST